MAIIGELAVNVVARTDKLTKGLKGARKQVAGMSKQFKAAAVGVSNFAKAAIGIGGGLGALGVAASMRSAAESIDRLAKTSQKLGIATEELAGLHVAAERTGVQVNQLEMGLQRMVRRVSEAAKGTGEAKDAIAELGLNARELNRLAPEKQFSRIAQQMAGVTNQSDKIRLAFKLFDSEGVNLIRTLDLGEKGLKEMREEAERLGLAVSSEDAAKVEKFNDALDRMKSLIGATGRIITITIAPGALKFIEGLEALIAPKEHRDALGPTLTGVKSEGFLRPLGRALESTQRIGTTHRAPARTDIRTQGVPLRPGEVMSPEQARRLVTVNEEQLRLGREAAQRDKERLRILQEDRRYQPTDPFVEVQIPGPGSG